MDDALRRFKRKVQTEDIIEKSEAPLFLPEAGREAPREASLSAKASPKEDSQRIRMSNRVATKWAAVRRAAAFTTTFQRRSKFS